MRCRVVTGRCCGCPKVDKPWPSVAVVASDVIDTNGQFLPRVCGVGVSSFSSLRIRDRHSRLCKRGMDGTKRNETTSQELHLLVRSSSEHGCIIEYRFRRLSCCLRSFRPVRLCQEQIRLALYLIGHFSFEDATCITTYGSILRRPGVTAQRESTLPPDTTFRPRMRALHERISDGTLSFDKALVLL